MSPGSLRRLSALVRRELEGAGAAHDFSHALRVAGFAKAIAGRERGVDMAALRAMCLLHDICRPEGEDGPKAVALSVKRARTLLAEAGFHRSAIRRIIRGIASHSLVSRGGRISDMVREPETLEEKILFDADKLDALGPVGIARWFITNAPKGWGPEKGARTYLSIMDSFLRARGGLYTRGGNRLAKPRIRYSRAFMEMVLREASPAPRPGQRPRKP